MKEIYEILLISTASIGLYISFVLLFISRENRLLNRLLGVFALTMAVFYLLVFSILRNWAPDFMVLIRTFLPLHYFMPAIGYLYFRTFIQDDTRLSRKDLIHALPFGLHLIYISPLLYHILSGQIQWTEILAKVDQQTYFFNFGPIPDRLHVIFRLSLILLYTFLCWKCYFSKKYRDFLERNKNNYPSAQRWIFFYLITITSNGIFAILMKSKIFFLNSKSVLYSGDLVSLCLLLGFDLLFVYAVFHPEILFGMPHFNRLNQPSNSENTPARSFRFDRLIRRQSNRILITEQNETEELEDAHTLVTVFSETEEPLLQPEIIQEEEKETEIDESVRQLIAEMDTYILLNQPYRQQEFNIASLSEALQAPQHHIAYIFRQVLKKSFVDYRNELRVNHAIESIREGKHQDITIEAIGTDAGFSSRATFFAVFKKLTGKTPGQFAADEEQDIKDQSESDHRL